MKAQLAIVLACWLAGLFTYLLAWLVGWLVDWLVSWLLACCLVDWVIGCLLAHLLARAPACLLAFIGLLGKFSPPRRGRGEFDALVGLYLAGATYIYLV